MNGGNILLLQKILGHSNLTMTMRYAHLASEHFQVLDEILYLDVFAQPDRPTQRSKAPVR